MRRALSKRPTNYSRGATVDWRWPVVSSDEAGVVHLNRRGEGRDEHQRIVREAG
jgi:hypothetical protein